MTVIEVLLLFAYDEWANDRLLTAVERLPPEQVTRQLGGSFPTIGDTMGHIVAGEWIWMRRLQGASPTARPDWVTGTAPSALRARLREVEGERASFLRSLTGDALARPVPYTLMNGAHGEQPLGDLLTHVVNHSTYHRGQVATMLRQVGAVPPATDFLVFKSA